MIEYVRKQLPTLIRKVITDEFARESRSKLRGLRTQSVVSLSLYLSERRNNSGVGVDGTKRAKAIEDATSVLVQAEALADYGPSYYSGVIEGFTTGISPLLAVAQDDNDYIAAVQVYAQKFLDLTADWLVPEQLGSLAYEEAQTAAFRALLFKAEAERDKVLQPVKVLVAAFGPTPVVGSSKEEYVLIPGWIEQHGEGGFRGVLFEAPEFSHHSVVNEGEPYNSPFHDIDWVTRLVGTNISRDDMGRRIDRIAQLSTMAVRNFAEVSDKNDFLLNAMKVVADFRAGCKAFLD